MDKKYLFIGTLDSLIIAPPFYADDPSTGLLSDALDAVRAVYDPSDELKVWMASGSIFMQPRTHYTKLIAGMMAAYPESVLYLVDGYPAPLLTSALRDIGRLVMSISNVGYDPNAVLPVLSVVQTNKEDTGITDYKAKLGKAGTLHNAERTPLPKLLYSWAESTEVMWKRFDEAESHGKKNGYTVCNFHTQKLADLFPQIETYITRTIERARQEQLGRMAGGRGGAPSSILSAPTLGEA